MSLWLAYVDRTHHAGARVDGADDVVVGVGDVDGVAGHAHPAWLVELCASPRPVTMAGLASACKRPDSSGSRIQQLDLVVVGVGDDNAPVVNGHAKRVLKTHGVADAVYVAELEQVASAQRANLVGRRQRDRANNVGFGIGDVQGVAVHGQT